MTTTIIQGYNDEATLAKVLRLAETERDELAQECPVGTRLLIKDAWGDALAATVARHDVLNGTVAVIITETGENYEDGDIDTILTAAQYAALIELLATRGCLRVKAARRALKIK